MPEVLTYTTPQATPNVVTVKIIGREEYLEPEPLIRYILKDSNGKVFDAYYRADEGALAMMVAANKMNFTTNSQYKRSLERLRDDGKLSPGTVTGSPD